MSFDTCPNCKTATFTALELAWQRLDAGEAAEVSCGQCRFTYLHDPPKSRGELEVNRLDKAAGIMPGTTLGS